MLICSVIWNENNSRSYGIPNKMDLFAVASARHAEKQSGKTHWWTHLCHSEPKSLGRPYFGSRGRLMTSTCSGWVVLRWRSRWG